MSGEPSPEIQAMVKMEQALSGLDEEAVNRVLQWTISRFGTQAVSADGSGAFAEKEEPEFEKAGEEVTAPDEFEDLASLYDAASPSTDADKALVCAYWFQEIQGHSSFTSMAINKELKHLGHGVSNITRTLGGLKSKKPALVMQRRKEGKTQQARKLYALTGEGKKAVKRMLRGAE